MSAWWAPLLPPSMRSHLEGRPLVQAILGNTGWLFADRLMRMGIGLVVGVWVARYLGPERYGIFNYAAALAGSFVVFASLDLDGVLVRELTLRPEEKGALLGTAFRMRLGTGLLCVLAVVWLAIVLRPGDVEVLRMTLFFSVALMTPAPDIIEAWFRSRLEAQWVVAARGTAYLLVAGLRVGLILWGAGTLAFAGAAAAEAALASVALYIAFRWRGQVWSDWTWDSALALRLLRIAAPMMISSLAIIAYMKIDQFMLAAMVDDKEVGLYSAAIRLSELWYFMPLALASSAAPALSGAFAQGEAAFQERWIKLFKAMIYMAVPVALFMTLAARPICDLLFGADYRGSGPILALHIWAALFVFVGVAQGAGELVRLRTKQTMLRSWIGAVTNILLNLLWIPRWHSMGAAAATVISYFVAGTLALAITREGRQDLAVQWQAFRSMLVRS